MTGFSFLRKKETVAAPFQQGIPQNPKKNHKLKRIKKESQNRLTGRSR